MRPMLGLILLLMCAGYGRAVAPPFEKTAYRCEVAQGCQRIAQADKAATSEHLSLQACRLVCSASAGLWPLPTGPMRTGHEYLPVDPRSFNLSLSRELNAEVKAFLSEAMASFESDLRAICTPPCRSARTSVHLQLDVDSSNMHLGWEISEAYNLEITGDISTKTVLIRAQSVYGVRHGLETLSQLIAPVPGGLVMLAVASIRDKPVFRHRGLLIDTARNFLPVSDILRTIDGLASVKMNVLHWHASDSQSFPLEIRNVSQMASYGAYGPEQVYSVEDMQRISRYANSKGVRLILEIDGPSHAGAGWQWGPQHGLGELALCVERQPWREFCVQPPCGQLNPVNANTSRVLRSIYRELLATFGRSQLMHLGGDELFINCWNASEEVTRAMESMGMGRSIDDFLKLWSIVHQQQLRMLDEESGEKHEAVIVWSSQLTAPERIEDHLDKRRFVVQTWVEAGSELVEQLLSLGYRLLVSTKDAWYLDHGFWGRTVYHSWRDAYANRIPRHPALLGGEACLWTEYVSSDSLDGRLWPRAAAVAERLWSDPEGSALQAESRMQAHVERLRYKQLRPESIAPQWCDQHEGYCH